MTKPMSLAAFTRLSPAIRVTVVEGLSATIDGVAAAAPDSLRRFDYAWYSAALAASGGHARTLLVESDGTPVIALPVIGVGPDAAGLVMVPGPNAPGRGFPAVAEIADAAGSEELRAEDAERIHRGLATLSIEHREAITLRFLEDMSYDEIAAVVGCSVGTVRSRLHYAKKHLVAAIREPADSISN